MNAWEQEADELNASLGEYLRMMVQAGRKELGYVDAHSLEDNQDANIESQAIEALREHDGDATWDELRNAVLGGLEQDLEEAIEQLEDEGTLKTSVSSDRVKLLE